MALDMQRRVLAGILVIVCSSLVLTWGIPVHVNTASLWNKDCFILCHYECNMWKGTDITHCAHQCMSKGFELYRKNFQPQWCFNSNSKMFRKRAESSPDYMSDFIEDYFGTL